MRAPLALSALLLVLRSPLPSLSENSEWPTRAPPGPPATPLLTPLPGEAAGKPAAPRGPVRSSLCARARTRSPDLAPSARPPHSGPPQGPAPRVASPPASARVEGAEERVRGSRDAAGEGVCRREKGKLREPGGPTLPRDLEGRSSLFLRVGKEGQYCAVVG